MGKEQISSNSRRVAKNTLLLYVRMLLLMFIGLITSRVILSSLGIEDYGTYNAVGGVVILFTLLSNSIAQAISRFITFELGKGGERLKEIFAASVWVQAGLALLLTILVNTLGLWFLLEKMSIPEGRMNAAVWVLEFSLITLIINLFAVPYNATIIAHEKMGAFAVISLIEGAMKLMVAAAIWLCPGDKLIIYAILMAAVALIVRLSYATYCRRHFEESRGRKKMPERALVRELAGFAGWNFFGSSAFVINTHGINLLVNVFFGVSVNAARGIAAQVEGIVKQFATNFLTALNPQITKSFAADNRNYCFELVTKGARYTYIILLLFAIPFAFEAETLLNLWLGAGKVAPFSALFVRLTIVGIMVDMVCNPLLTLELAYGKIRNYYLITGAIAYLALPVTWVLFKWTSAPEWTPYVVFIGIYFLVDVAKLTILKHQVDFPVGQFLKETVLQCGAVTIIAATVTGAVWYYIPIAWARLLAVLFCSTASIAVFTWLLAMTKGEKQFVLSKLKRNE